MYTLIPNNHANVTFYLSLPHGPQPEGRQSFLPLDFLLADFSQEHMHMTRMLESLLNAMLLVSI